MFDTTDITETAAGAPGAPELAAIMSASWIAFARTGAPQIDALPRWSEYSADQRTVMVFDRDCRTVTDPDRDARLLWARIATGVR